MNINKIDFTRMRNDEHFQFHVEFRALVQRYDAVKSEGGENLSAAVNKE